MIHKAYLKRYKTQLVLEIKHINNGYTYKSIIPIEDFYKRKTGAWFSMYQANNGLWVSNPTLKDIIIALNAYIDTLNGQGVKEAIQDLLGTVTDYIVKYPKRQHITPFIRYYNVSKKQEQN